MGIHILAAIMTSRTKFGKSTIFFAILIGVCSGAPPLDVSEFFGSPAASSETTSDSASSSDPLSSSKARSGSDEIARLLSLLSGQGGGVNNLQAFANFLGQSKASQAVVAPTPEPEDIITDVTINCRFESQDLANGGCNSDCAQHQGRCLCPRNTRNTCEDGVGSKQCYWLVVSPGEGKCIHQTERLYNALFEKLNKRGKKDFAIQVFYNSRPAKVHLPNGLYGPHIVGAFSHLQHLRPQNRPIGYNSHINSYGYGGYNYPKYGGYNQGYGGYSKPYYPPPKEYEHTEDYKEDKYEPEPYTEPPPTYTTESPITTNLLNLMDINPLMEVIVNLMGTNHLLMEDTVNHTHQNLMVKPMVIKNLHMATPHLIMDTKDNQAMRAILPKNNSFQSCELL